MGRFIRITIEESSCPAGCRMCLEACPVEIFKEEGGKVLVLDSEEDECTLCELCIQRCGAGAISIEKLY